MNSRTHGFTHADLLAVLACVLTAVIMTTIALGQQESSGAAGVRGQARSLKDATQVRGIHQSFIIFAKEFGDIFPRPGLIDRLPDNGAEVPGRGPEDTSQNTTACLHAAMIMQNYYAPEIVVSPIERNQKVRVAAHYNYESYNVIPSVDTYWDPKFKADLASESNVSYANLVIFGTRVESQWKASLDARYAVMSNRGPKGGAIDPDSMTCGPHGNWAGNVCFNDNHVDMLDRTSPPNLTVKNAQGIETPDNLFAIDDGMKGGDIILTFTKAITKDGAEVQWD